MKGKKGRHIKISPRFFAIVALAIVVVVTAAFFFTNMPAKNFAKNSKVVIEAAETLQTAMAEVASTGKETLYSKEEKEMAAVKARIKSGDTKGLKVVYMTFDDGPSENTGEILDILKKYNIKATFFTNGRDSDMARAAYKRIVAEGHTLGNHTWSHNYGLYKNPVAFYEDVEKLEAFQKEVTGLAETSRVFRFPGGSLNANATCIKGILDRGYNYADWNASAGDGGGNPSSPDAVIQKITAEVHQYDVTTVLCHAELRSNSKAALPKLFETLKAEGYIFLPMEADMSYPRHV